MLDTEFLHLGLSNPKRLDDLAAPNLVRYKSKLSHCPKQNEYVELKLDNFGRKTKDGVRPRSTTDPDPLSPSILILRQFPQQLVIFQCGPTWHLIYGSTATGKEAELPYDVRDRQRNRKVLPSDNGTQCRMPVIILQLLLVPYLKQSDQKEPVVKRDPNEHNEQIFFNSVSIRFII